MARMLRWAHLRERREASQLAAPLAALARLPKLRSLAMRVLCRIEGGLMWSRSYRRLMLDYYGVSIGRYSYGPCLAPGVLPAGTVVGNYCSIADGVLVFRRNHPLHRPSHHPFFYNRNCGLLEEDSIPCSTSKPLRIGHDVWVGANAIITPRCDFIGNGSVVGTGAVVTANVPEFSIVAGNPARVVRQRFIPEVASALSESRWWEAEVGQLIPALALFLEDLSLERAEALRSHVKRLRSQVTKLSQSREAE